MRLEFNILWVEDQPGAVKAQMDRIAVLLRKEGFKLQTQFATTLDEAKTFLASDIYGDHIDLVLMDYDFGAGPKGDDGLVEVRHKFQYKDIVFYSAQTSQLLEKVMSKQLQGVFCSTRNDLPDSVYGVFENLVKKVLDIDHARGIVMGASSDIDHLVNQCLLTTFNASDNVAREATFKFVAARMKEIRSTFEKTANAIDQVTHVQNLFDKHAVYTSIDRLNLLRKSLTATGQFAPECESMKEYVSKTVPKRNDLAHVRVVREGFQRKLLDRNNQELTASEMKALRVSLLDHFEKFEALEAALQASLQKAA